MQRVNYDIKGMELSLSPTRMYVQYMMLLDKNVKT